MTKSLFILIVLLATGMNLMSAQKHYFDTPYCNDSVYSYINVDKLPKCTGIGHTTLEDYIYKHMSYPAEADIQGRILVSFIVTKQGTISSVRIEKSLHHEADQDIKNILYAMPKWKPGRKGGKKVHTVMYLHLDYKLYGPSDLMNK